VSGPGHLSGSALALVAAGGAVGTTLRYLTTLLVPSWRGLPMATLGINVVGAFMLGVLLERLAGRASDCGWNRRVRLAVGTGVLGGFTTYSTLATDVLTLAADQPGRALAYGLGTVVLGAAGSAAGIWLARGQLGPARVERSRR